MVTSTVTAKGQTTIPVEVRNFLNIHTGDKIEYIMKENGEVLLAPKNISISELRKVLPKPRRKLSLEEIEQAIQAGWQGETK